MNIEVRSVLAITTIIDSKINVLTLNNNLLVINCNDDIEYINNEYIKNNLIIKDLDLKQCYTFCKKESDRLNISILYCAIINSKDIVLKENQQFISIDKINDIYKEKIIEYLRKELVFNSVIKKIYPDEFILPEVQKLYEELLNKKFDRRNFRKRLIKLDVIEDLDKISSTKLGRPAKLYRFKDIIEDKIIF